jgi:hypothetical protein
VGRVIRALPIPHVVALVAGLHPEIAIANSEIAGERINA